MHLTPHFLYDVNIAWGPEWACCFLLLDTTLTLSTWKGHLYQGFLEHAAEIRACYHKGHRKGSANPVAPHLIVAQRSAHIDPIQPPSSTASLKHRVRHPYETTESSTTRYLFKGGDFEIDHFLIGPKWMFWCLHRLYVSRKGLL